MTRRLVASKASRRCITDRLSQNTTSPTRQVCRQHSAGAVALLDTQSIVKRVALIGGAAADDAQPLLSPLHYLEKDRKSTRLNSSHIPLSRMPSSA